MNSSPVTLKPLPDTKSASHSISYKNKEVGYCSFKPDGSFSLSLFDETLSFPETKVIFDTLKKVKG